MYGYRETSLELREARSYYIAKKNEIIQKARYDLTTQEIKILTYILSLIKPTDTEETEYTFSIQLYCKLAGIDYKNSGNYAFVKKSIKSLSDKSFWLTVEDGTEVLVRWLRKVKLKKGEGNIRVRLDEDVCKYLIGLKDNYYQYEFINTLPMSCSQSIILYELLKSYQYNHDEIEIELESLRKKLNCEFKYKQFRDFKKRLDLYVKEINLYTDLEVSYEKIIEFGKKVKSIKFFIEKKDNQQRIKAWLEAEDKLDSKNQIDGQMTIFDY